MSASREQWGRHLSSQLTNQGAQALIRFPPQRYRWTRCTGVFNSAAPALSSNARIWVGQTEGALSRSAARKKHKHLETLGPVAAARGSARGRTRAPAKAGACSKQNALTLIANSAPHRCLRPVPRRCGKASHDTSVPFVPSWNPQFSAGPGIFYPSDRSNTCEHAYIGLRGNATWASCKRMPGSMMASRLDASLIQD